jgi:hypothetical protein
MKNKSKKRKAHNKIDITGKRFGHLVVKYETDRASYWLCECDCGGQRVLHTGKLRHRGVDRCKGCMSLKKSLSATKHGSRGTKLYGVWNTMKQRCSNPNVQMYYRYGGRGIEVCEEWKNSFEVFMDFAINNGYADGMSIERLDNNKGYTPENCTFIPISEQPKNRSVCKIFDEDKPVIIKKYNNGYSQSQIAKMYNVHPSRIGQILKELGIERRSNAIALRKLSDETAQRMCTIRQNTGKSFKEIGKLFNVSGETARKEILNSQRTNNGIQ